MKPEFNQHTIIVTGGTQGLGRGISKSFLTAGAEVIVAARRAANPPVEIDSKRAHFFECDVRDPEASQALIDFALEKTGRLDVLINNAGGGPQVDAASASPRLIRSVIDLNLVAPAVVSQQAHQAIECTTGTGSIINIASVSATRPSPGTAAYGAAKAGLVNLTRSLAQEWAPAVRVNVIIAGLARTENSEEHYGGEEGIARIESRMPMKRMATPKDIGKACLFLASAEAAYISGATLEVHGGGEPPAFLSLQRDND